MPGWFSAKLGSKISDGSQLSSQFLGPPTATGTQQTGINHFYSSIWIQQTALNGGGRDSLGLCCPAGLVFSKTWGQKSVMDPSCQHNFWGHQQPQGHNKQEPNTFILPYGSNKQHCMEEKEFHWVFGFVQVWFSAKLGGSKISDGSQLSEQFPYGHQQPQGHNKQEPTTFILPYGSNKQHCMDKEDFHWVFGVMQGWFSAKLGVKDQ
jgi:hypothetical protein